MEDFELQLRATFLEEALQLLQDCETCFLSLETDPHNSSLIDQIFRLAHSLKGSAGAVGLDQVSKFAHQFESYLLKIKQGTVQVDGSAVSLMLKCNDVLGAMVRDLHAGGRSVIDTMPVERELIEAMALVVPAPKSAAASPSKAPPPADDGLVLFAPETPVPAPAPAASAPVHAPAEGKAAAPAAGAPVDESIRVSLGRLDKLMDNVGELVILQASMSQNRHLCTIPMMQRNITQMDKIIREVQEISMGLRMVPMKQTFQKMQRIVRDTSAQLQKQVNFTVMGEDTEIDKTVLEAINDPLVHLVRNAVDHGLESTEARLAAGKPATGQVWLVARHEGNNIVIEVREDGRGIDLARVRAKAIDNGLVRPDVVLTDEQITNLIFAPGLSTKTVVTDISGRGVGLDVVKTNIARLQGSISVQSVQGKGSTFIIHLPLTLAIIEGMVVRSVDERFVIPMHQIHETLRPGQQDISTIGEKSQTIALRGETLPLFRLDRLLGRPAKTTGAPWEAIMLIVRGGKVPPFALQVDDIINQQQIVIKRLGREIRDSVGLSGAAILGDGKAALIIDLVELVRAKGLSQAKGRDAASGPKRGAAA